MQGAVPSRSRELPVTLHDLPSEIMEQVGCNLFHWAGQTYLIMVDFMSAKPFVKCLGNSASSEKVIDQIQKWFEE